MKPTGRPLPPRNFMRAGARLLKDCAICLVLRRFSLRSRPSRGTSGRPCRVTQSGEYGRPPGLGEVLGLVDHDRIETVEERSIGGQRHHEFGELLFPVGGVILGAGWHAPADAQRVKGLDVGGALVSRERVHPSGEVLGQAARVAHERDPFSRCGQSTGLLDGEPGLARSRPASDLDPGVAGHQVEDSPLIRTEQFAGVLALEETVQQIPLWDRRAGDTVQQ